MDISYPFAKNVSMDDIDNDYIAQWETDSQIQQVPLQPHACTWTTQGTFTCQPQIYQPPAYGQCTPKQS